MLTSASFRAMGTTVVVAVEDPPALALAASTARAVITEIDRACSRFREDSELSQINSAAGSGFVHVSALLDEVIGVALDAAAATGGLVDPTIGALIERAGYTVTFTDLPLDGPAIELEIRSAPGWESVLHRRCDRMVALPDGASLDLGAVGKAWAADRAAHAAAARIGGAALVSCGGDVAVAGPDRADGWRVRVAQAIDAADSQDVLVFDGGLATSGTESRTWRRGGQTLHHILDPSTGLPSVSPWLMASVAAATCAGANAAATGAIVLGDGAPSWLAAHGLPARLVHRDGSILTIGSWPQQSRATAS
jgi:thiamine biosynthesis lipoprotein ApbE